MMHRCVGFALLIFLTIFAFIQSYADSVNGLIPRSVLFSSDNYSRVRLSPNGRYISYLSVKDGISNVYVSKLDSINSSRQVTYYNKNCIKDYAWTYDNNYILYHYDDSGKQNTQIHALNVETGEIRNLTQFQDVTSKIYKLSYKSPDRILAMTNKRDAKYFDIIEIEVGSGKSRMIYENKDGYIQLTFDDLYRLRFASKFSGNDVFSIYQFDKSLKPNLLLKSSLEDYLDTQILSVRSDDETITMLDSINQDKPDLVEIDLSTGKKTISYKIHKGGFSSFLRHPITQRFQAVQVDYDKKRWEVLDDDIKEDLQYLQSINSGVVDIISRTLQDDKWLVRFYNDHSSGIYYLYNRINKKAEAIFKNKAMLDKYKLSKMHPIEIKSRDGLTMLSYLTLPLNSLRHSDEKRPVAPVPLIMNVHGGPNARDEWGLDRIHQFFANRGYAVLSVNYRGSTGFGKKFFNAGNAERGGKMHLDIIDAANWAVENKIALKEKIAIFGASYGGYEALVGLTFTPEFFVCGVDIVGPSNIITSINGKPAYWQPSMGGYLKGWGIDKGKNFLISRSPLTYADRITKPLLIVQGENDPIVKKAESDQMVDAMKKHNIPVTYVLYKNEGHGFSDPANKVSFFAIVELFFSKYLGGAAEPLSDEIEKSSAVFLEGKSLLNYQ